MADALPGPLVPGEADGDRNRCLLDTLAQLINATGGSTTADRLYESLLDILPYGSDMRDDLRNGVMLDIYHDDLASVLESFGFRLQVFQTTANAVVRHPVRGVWGPMRFLHHQGAHFTPLWPNPDPVTVVHQPIHRQDAAALATFGGYLRTWYEQQSAVLPVYGLPAGVFAVWRQFGCEIYDLAGLVAEAFAGVRTVDAVRTQVGMVIDGYGIRRNQLGVDGEVLPAWNGGDGRAKPADLRTRTASIPESGSARQFRPSSGGGQSVEVEAGSPVADARIAGLQFRWSPNSPSDRDGAHRSGPAGDRGWPDDDLDRPRGWAGTLPDRTQGDRVQGLIDAGQGSTPAPIPNAVQAFFNRDNNAANGVARLVWETFLKPTTTFTGDDARRVGVIDVNGAAGNLMALQDADMAIREPAGNRRYRYRSVVPKWSPSDLEALHDWANRFDQPRREHIWALIEKSRKSTDEPVPPDVRKRLRSSSANLDQAILTWRVLRKITAAPVGEHARGSSSVTNPEQASNARPLTGQEIIGHAGLKSKRTALRYLSALHREGMVDRQWDAALGGHLYWAVKPSSWSTTPEAVESSGRAGGGPADRRDSGGAVRSQPAAHPPPAWLPKVPDEVRWLYETPFGNGQALAAELQELAAEPPDVEVAASMQSGKGLAENADVPMADVDGNRDGGSGSGFPGMSDPGGGGGQFKPEELDWLLRGDWGSPFGRRPTQSVWSLSEGPAEAGQVVESLGRAGGGPADRPGSGGAVAVTARSTPAGFAGPVNSPPVAFVSSAVASQPAAQPSPVWPPAVDEFRGWVETFVGDSQELRSLPDLAAALREVRATRGWSPSENADVSMDDVDGDPDGGSGYRAGVPSGWRDVETAAGDRGDATSGLSSTTVAPVSQAPPSAGAAPSTTRFVGLTVTRRQSLESGRGNEGGDGADVPGGSERVVDKGKQPMIGALADRHTVAAQTQFTHPTIVSRPPSDDAAPGPAGFASFTVAREVYADGSLHVGVIRYIGMNSDYDQPTARRSAIVTVTSASTADVSGTNEKNQSWERPLLLEPALTNDQIVRLRTEAKREKIRAAPLPAGFIPFAVSRTVNSWGRVSLDGVSAFVRKADQNHHSTKGQVVTVTVTSASTIRVSGTNQDGRLWNKSVVLKAPLNDTQITHLRIEEASLSAPTADFVKLIVRRKVSPKGWITLGGSRLSVGTTDEHGRSTTRQSIDVTVTSASTIHVSRTNHKNDPWNVSLRLDPPLNSDQVIQLRMEAADHLRAEQMARPAERSAAGGAGRGIGGQSSTAGPSRPVAGPSSHPPGQSGAYAGAYRNTSGSSAPDPVLPSSSGDLWATPGDNLGASPDAPATDLHAALNPPTDTSPDTIIHGAIAEINLNRRLSPETAAQLRRNLTHLPDERKVEWIADLTPMIGGPDGGLFRSLAELIAGCWRQSQTHSPTPTRAATPGPAE